MSLGQSDRLLLAADAEARAWPSQSIDERPRMELARLRQVPLPVDVTDAARFPNIKAAHDHLASLSPEGRAELDAEWSASGEMNDAK